MFVTIQTFWFHRIHAIDLSIGPIDPQAINIGCVRMVGLFFSWVIGDPWLVLGAFQSRAATKGSKKLPIKRASPKFNKIGPGPYKMSRMPADAGMISEGRTIA